MTFASISWENEIWILDRIGAFVLTLKTVFDLLVGFYGFSLAFPLTVSVLDFA